MAINDDIETFGSYVSGSRLLDRVTQAEQAQAGQYEDPLMSAWGSAGQAVAGAVNSAFGLVTPKTRAMESIARRNELARTMEANKIMPGTPESAQLGEIMFQDMPQELEAFRQAQFNAAKKLDFAKYGEHLTTSQLIGIVERIDDDLNKSDQAKEYRSSREKLKQINGAITKTGQLEGMTDVQLVRLFLQINEPNSAITEGENELFGQAQGLIFARLGITLGMAAQNPGGAATGKFLAESSRKHIVDQANAIVAERYGQLLKSANEAVQGYASSLRPETLEKIRKSVYNEAGDVRRISRHEPVSYVMDAEMHKKEQERIKKLERIFGAYTTVGGVGVNAVKIATEAFAEVFHGTYPAWLWGNYIEPAVQDVIDETGERLKGAQEAVKAAMVFSLVSSRITGGSPKEQLAVIDNAIEILHQTLRQNGLPAYRNQPFRTQDHGSIEERKREQTAAIFNTLYALQQKREKLLSKMSPSN